MADIYELIDRYKELLDERDRLKDLQAENTTSLDAARRELTAAMIEEESPKVSRGGFLYSLQDKTKYSKAGGVDEDEFFAVLEDNGIGDIIKRTVNAQTLQGAMSAAAEENGGELPEEYADYINVYQYYDVQKRKETNRAATTAKNK